MMSSLISKTWNVLRIMSTWRKNGVYNRLIPNKSSVGASRRCACELWTAVDFHWVCTGREKRKYLFPKNVKTTCHDIWAGSRVEAEYHKIAEMYSRAIHVRAAINECHRISVFCVFCHSTLVEELNLCETDPIPRVYSSHRLRKQCVTTRQTVKEIHAIQQTFQRAFS